MKKITVWIVCLYLAGAAVVLAEEAQTGFPSLEFLQPLTRPVAVFDHDVHNEAHELTDCSLCHHLYEEGELVEGESSEDKPCSECHALSKTPENDVPLRKAFHLQCRECHDEKGQGPRLCGECHQKK